MRWLLMIIWLNLILFPVFGQEGPDGRDFPRYPVSVDARLKSSVVLPAKINLAKSKYFPDIFEQYGWSCNQSSSIGYLLTYELNRLRNADGGLPGNRYSPMYVWNFLNDTKYGNGVSYFDSWEIIKAGGAPSEADYANHSDLKLWMSGYDKYYRAMQNRVLKNWSLPVGTPEDLQVLKRYLYDHFDGSKFGGMANFQIASGGMNLAHLPRNSYDEGASFITTFGSNVGHALTIVGYNDSIRLDRNDDGVYTNNIDINGDRIIDLNDFEKGALIVANTWGKGWGDNGFAYVPYHLLSQYGWEGGLWNKSVHIIEAAKTFDPILILRTELTHTCRSNLRIMAGVSNDPNATEPEHILELPMFNYQGAAVPLYSDQRPDTTRFELGLDISPLVDFINTDGPVKIFLIVDEKDSWNGNDGLIRSMSVYNNFTVRDSTVCDLQLVPVRNNSRTLLSVVRPVRFNRITITPVPILFSKPGDIVSIQMAANGASSPYAWELVPDYRIEFGHAGIPEWGGNLLYNGQFGSPVSRIKLPFKFKYFGVGYDYISITEDAELLFDQEEYGYPYVIDKDLVFRSVRKISGFGSDLDYYMDDNAVSYLANDSILAVTWNAMAPSDQGGFAIKIVCEIRPDGWIRFVYSKPDQLFPVGATVDLGVSNGDNFQFSRVSEFNPDHTDGVNSMIINPYLNPEETKFDETGWLFCRPAKANTQYEVKVRVVDKNNRMAWSTIQISTRDLSSAPVLSESFPNPFTNETRFKLTVPEKATVLAEVFDLAGRRIAVLCEGEYIAAEYDIVWDGAGVSGSPVGPGVYICRVKVGERTASCKMIKVDSSGYR